MRSKSAANAFCWVNNISGRGFTNVLKRIPGRLGMRTRTGNLHETLAYSSWEIPGKALPSWEIEPREKSERKSRVARSEDASLPHRIISSAHVGNFNGEKSDRSHVFPKYTQPSDARGFPSDASFPRTWVRVAQSFAASYPVIGRDLAGASTWHSLGV